MIISSYEIITNFSILRFKNVFEIKEQIGNNVSITDIHHKIFMYQIQKKYFGAYYTSLLAIDIFASFTPASI